MNDDDPVHGDRDPHRSRPYGSSRRPRASGGFERLFDGLGGGGQRGLFDRIMRDVSSWFDEDEERGARRHGIDERDVVPGRRTTGRQSRQNARSQDYTDDFGDVGGGSAFSQHDAPRGRDDGYADEDGDGSGSLRGRGPRNYRRSDERVVELVSDALHDDDALDASDIEVSVKDGDVRLEGSVPLRRHKHRAENVAARVSGRHDVDNRLRVRRETASAAPSTSPGGTPGEARRDADDYGHPS